MGVESDADRLSFLADFNGDEPTPFLWGATPVTVIGHRGAVIMEAEDGAAVLNNRATVQCREIDVPPGGAEGDACTFRGVAHTVKSIQRDGTGMAVVLLEEVV